MDKRAFNFKGQVLTKSLLDHLGLTPNRLNAILDQHCRERDGLLPLVIPNSFSLNDPCIIHGDQAYNVEIQMKVTLLPSTSSEVSGESTNVDHHSSACTSNLIVGGSGVVEEPPILPSKNREEMIHSSGHSVLNSPVSADWYRIVESSRSNSIKNVTHVLSNRRYTTVELFAGCGGLALGMEQAGFETIAIVENDRHCCNTLRRNRPNWNVTEECIVKVCRDKTWIQNVISRCEHTGGLDLIAGGFPCQSFSTLGKQHGFDDSRGMLFLQFAEMLKLLQPKMFVAENVKGLVIHGQGRSFGHILQTFSDCNYTVCWKLLNAVDFGVAQKRERLFIVGVRNDLVAKHPDAKYAHPQSLGTPPLTLRECLRNVPPSPGSGYSEKKRLVMAHVPEGGNWKDVPAETLKLCYKETSKPLGSNMARRLSWDEPSPTVLTTPSESRSERCHPEETRPFTLRESARIQSFPDTWEIYGPVGEAYKQIGNAVPVNLAKYMGLSCIDFLNSIHDIAGNE
jgi:DNA (cytosine-5)-methyltransferase 1